VTSGATVSVHMVRAILMGAAERGVSPPELCARFGLAPEVLATEDGRVPASAIIALWEEVPGLCGDSAFGLHLGERMPVPPHPVLGYAMRQSATFGDALGCFFRFQRLAQNVAYGQIAMLPGGPRMTVQPSPGVGPLPRHALEHGFAATVALGRQLTGVADIAPRAVYFAHPAPADTREHQRVFRAPVHFDADAYAMDFDASVLELPLPAADPALRRVLESYAQTLADQVPSTFGIASRVRHVLHDALHGGRADLASVAKSLRVSERTLQRRLREEGTSHQQLLEEERARLATHYVGQSSLSLQEIAFMLGFGDQAAFHRAFVRWTSRTPGAFRQQVLAGGVKPGS
jgi:AraC-like DNA-binding protein